MPLTGLCCLTDPTLWQLTVLTGLGLCSIVGRWPFGPPGVLGKKVQAYCGRSLVCLGRLLTASAPPTLHLCVSPPLCVCAPPCS